MVSDSKAGTKTGRGISSWWMELITNNCGTVEFEGVIESAGKQLNKLAFAIWKTHFCAVLVLELS